ncbi:N-acetylmuramoyl-L-alanine amidase [Frankia sp. AgPm24]|uniref:N-acetylmuramoyl-L-alanine amidase n=1 Tax=Frankia sp. AgPm24 TaxID=631128 RepID=UPI00200C4141|nr:N-acetylmuramoyl-L-alanine amidase [Frankia sp. AgPm24]MCK9924791.1 N-acetylmuramoyl-L-alanine amidase [Frankia sp. AgPm24]
MADLSISSNRSGLSRRAALRLAGAGTGGMLAATFGLVPTRAEAAGVGAAGAGAVVAGAAVVPSGVAGVRYVPRAGWGADESWRINRRTGQPWPVEFAPGQVITVHHTAIAVNDADPAASVRAIYRGHTKDRGWADIGYHLLIDNAGAVYEGRRSGADTVPVYEADGRAVTGAHVQGNNAGNIGVALMGDLRTRPPTPQARRSLALVLLALAGRHQLDPTGMATYINPTSGARRQIPTISGHRDWMGTACPGDALFALLPGLRRDVAVALGRPLPPLPPPSTVPPRPLVPPQPLVPPRSPVAPGAQSLLAAAP